jgi:MFS family permease
MKKNRVKKSLWASLWDGVFASAMTGLTTDYITPYALFLKATSSQIGFLSAAPNLVSSLFQLSSADLVEKLKSRKKIIILFVFLHLLMFVPTILIPYFFKTQPVFYLIIFVTLFTSLNAFALPAWSSLMAEYIPYKMRGKYFGWRSKVTGTVTIIFSFVAGSTLYYFRNNLLKGFQIVFVLAMLLRFISWYFLTKMHEPPLKISRESYFSLLDFIKRLKESNFARFVVFVASLVFCVNIAAPFFAVFMLRDLKFSYLTYTVLVSSVTLTSIFTIDRWGKIADRVGNLKVLRFSSLFIASLPFWWIINQNPVYLLLIQVLSGFAWAGFNLCATNFIYDAVTPAKRTRCIAYFNVFSGMAICLGALSGGYLVNILPALFGYKILSLFLIASALRFLVVFFFAGKIQEVRPAEQIKSRDLFYSVIGLKPILGATQDSREVVRKEE